MTETWGISGSDFLAGYLAALVVVFVIAIAVRAAAVRGSGDGSTRPPTAAELALYTEGPTHAIYTSLAALRLINAIDVGPQQRLSAIGSIPPGMSSLDQAVFDAASRGVPVHHLGSDQRVRAALDEVRRSVDRAGWLLTEAERSRARTGLWLLLGLLALGVARLVAGVANDRPVGYLVIVLVVAGLATIPFARVPVLSATGKRTMAQQRQAYRHLSPDAAPAWGTYGFAGVAMGVALFGTSALWAVDPAFAETASITNRTISSSSSSSGGGDGGGSGGGDGGGGCGGGCGGCGG